jgi:hypothetical protein
MNIGQEIEGLDNDATGISRAKEILLELLGEQTATASMVIIEFESADSFSKHGLAALLSAAKTMGIYVKTKDSPIALAVVNKG